MRSQYFTFNNIDSIMFADDWNPVSKIRKNINVKGYVRKGKFVRSFKREQDVRETALKVAAVSLGVLGAALGVGIAGAAMTKVRYNKNLVDFGKKMKNNLDDVPNMKVPEGVKNITTPKPIGDKKSITFFVGGLDTFENAQGEKLLKSVRSAYAAQSKSIPKKMRKPPLEDRHELIPLFHNHQLKQHTKLGVAQDIKDVFEKAAVKGYNEDSVKMAKEIYKWHLENPTKPINIVTASAGGFQGRDIPHILEAAGVDTKKLMKVFSTASPDYGIVDEVVPTLKVMHNDDMYAKLMPNIKKAVGLPSLHRGTVFIGKGDTPMYRDMVARKGLYDTANTVGKEGDRFIAGKRYTPPGDWEMPAVVHFGPAYFNGETPTSKKTLQYLNNFMFKD